jgi:beta-glucosidase
VQEALVEAVAATGTPVVLVLLSGRPLGLARVADRVSAILEAWLPGAEAGHALAAVLFGDESPGGKLPISFPRSSAQIPVYYGHKASGGRSHWKGDYVDMPTTPLFAFGHGLSYTEFAYDDLRIEPAEVAPDGRVTVSLELRNAGSRVGDEVVQLYLRDPIASVTRPVQELKGFVRLTLQPGEARRVTFELPVALTGFYDRHMEFVVEPGVVEVMVGAASDDVRLAGSFTVTGATTPVARKVFGSDVTVA